MKDIIKLKTINQILHSEPKFYTLNRFKNIILTALEVQVIEIEFIKLIKLINLLIDFS